MSDLKKKRLKNQIHGELTIKQGPKVDPGGNVRKIGYEGEILEKATHTNAWESNGLKLDEDQILLTLIRVKQSVGAATLLDDVKH